jgi:hypothetical protein
MFSSASEADENVNIFSSAVLADENSFIFVYFIPSAQFHRPTDENSYFRQLSSYFRRFLADEITLFSCSVGFN